MTMTQQANKRIWTADSQKDIISFVKENVNEVADHSKLNYKLTYKDGTTEDRRLFVSTGGDVCYFGKGKRRYGYYLPTSNLQSVVLNIPVKQSEEKKFFNDCERIIKHLEVDGLWAEYIPIIKIMQVLGYEVTHKYYRNYYNSIEVVMQEAGELAEGEALTFKKEYDFLQKEYLKIRNILISLGKQDLIEAYDEASKGQVIDLRLAEFLSRKYGKIDNEYIGDYLKSPYFFAHMFSWVSHAKIKKMIFHKGRYGSYRTEEILKRIGNAIDEKRKWTESGDNGYDVSFEYNPEQNKAWYSEEYRDCGNGHYYIALNRTHAVYIEKD